MEEISLNKITTDSLSLPISREKTRQADVLRLDKIHPFVSGNKWFKLRYYLEEAKATGKKTIVTYGGAWSNHILATAAACKINGLHSIGIIRGEATTAMSPTLQQAKELGMQLIYMSREDYRQRKIPEELQQSGYYFIAEGGYGPAGADGAATILDHCRKENYTHICCAAGTGTMTAGLVKGALSTQTIIAVSVLKNNLDLEKDIQRLAANGPALFQLIHDYHFGGYAKYQPALIAFMNEFYHDTGVPSDFVYTGKLFFAINELARNNFFPEGSKIIIIHSGGLPGNASLSKGTLIF
ncbi:MAG: pyridoxal-phosphate dependent enzyme [Bacteroidota bacterium]